MYTKCKAGYGTEPIPVPAIKHGAGLSNGWYCVWTDKKPDGTVDADIYEDSTMRILVRMEHGIEVHGGMERETGIADLIESYLQEIIDEC
ncbi:MAG: hypothetical protein SPL63_10225 [Roseburia faecis]|nr:hypothetical protein [Roseburia faecis]